MREINLLGLLVVHCMNVQPTERRAISEGTLCHTQASCLSLQTLAEQGPRGLFKGMGAPLATVAFFNAVLFTSRGQMEQLLKHEDGVDLASSTFCAASSNHFQMHCPLFSLILKDTNMNLSHIPSVGLEGLVDYPPEMMLRSA